MKDVSGNNIQNENGDTFIKLEWIVTDILTEYPGTVTFAIIAEGDRQKDIYDNYFCLLCCILVV
jgi:hypothetical protein